MSPKTQRKTYSQELKTEAKKMGVIIASRSKSTGKTMKKKTTFLFVTPYTD